MAFNSLAFLIFLPLTIVLYFVVPHKFRWVVLLIASYYAYMSWNPWLIFLILATTVVSYLAGILMPKTNNPKIKKLLLIVTIVVCLGILIFFKYFNFLLASVISFLNLFSLHINSVALDIILPIGISFYTFQTLSYVIDVYRNKFPPEKHFGYFALYVSFFPQLIAGPIERPENLLPQLKEKHHVNKEDLVAGLQLLAVGFFRKCVVADFCGVFVNNVFNDLSNANSLALLGAGALFMVQLYCDFCGYSEIAAGAARMMGIKLSVNFNKPFTGTSIQRAMRNWHITLTSWFTDYIYIPLGGNKKGKPRQIFNIFVVYILCGLWHGANWTFALWGVYIWAITTVEALLKNPIRNFAAKHNINYHRPWIDVIRRVFVFSIFVFSTFFFRAQSIQEVGIIFARVFTQFGFSFTYLESSINSLGMKILDFIELGLILLVMLKLYDLAYDNSFTLIENGGSLLTKKSFGKNLIFILMITAIALGWFVLISSEANSAFIYFQF